jgi:hypothetical protein
MDAGVVGLLTSSGLSQEAARQLDGQLITKADFTRMRQNDTEPLRQAQAQIAQLTQVLSQTTAQAQPPADPSVDKDKWDEYLEQVKEASQDDPAALQSVQALGDALEARFAKVVEQRVGAVTQQVQPMIQQSYAQQFAGTMAAAKGVAAEEYGSEYIEKAWPYVTQVVAEGLRQNQVISPDSVLHSPQFKAHTAKAYAAHIDAQRSAANKQTAQNTLEGFTQSQVPIGADPGIGAAQQESTPEQIIAQLKTRGMWKS